jgi:excisionase family DNA binding protein
MSNNKVLLRRDEIAELLGISLASVISLCKSGQLRSIKLGRAVRIHVDDLAAFAKKGTENKTVNGQPLDALWRGRQA